ncbi:lysophospholipid acyltransferase family protein [bacterium]|nr:lysophospholipid acyltransferase family protein [bacterium]
MREIAIDRSPFFAIEVLSILRRRGLVLLAGDFGHEEHQRGRLYPFLGGNARFQNLPARISAASRAPLLPCFVVRDERSGYRLEIAEPIFPDERGEDGLMERLILVFEQYVRRFPEQWLCIHRYWSDGA